MTLRAKGVDVRAVMIALARRWGVDPAMAVDETRFTEFQAAIEAAKRRRVS